MHGIKYGSTNEPQEKENRQHMGSSLGIKFQGRKQESHEGRIQGRARVEKKMCYFEKGQPRCRDCHWILLRGCFVLLMFLHVAKPQKMGHDVEEKPGQRSSPSDWNYSDLNPFKEPDRLHAVSGEASCVHFSP